MNRLKEKYLNEVVPSLMEKYNYKSKMEVPKLDKIVINIGLGDVKENYVLENDKVYKTSKYRLNLELQNKYVQKNIRQRELNLKIQDLNLNNYLLNILKLIEIKCGLISILLFLHSIEIRIQVLILELL